MLLMRKSEDLLCVVFPFPDTAADRGGIFTLRKNGRGDGVNHHRGFLCSKPRTVCAVSFSIAAGEDGNMDDLDDGADVFG